MFKLHLDGKRPTGGLGGEACLCTAPSSYQRRKLTGTIDDTWRSTDGSLVNARLLERTIINVGQGLGGYFDLIGRWQGTSL